VINRFKIEGRPIGLDEPCLIVGEVAQAHDGSLGMAHAFIDAIADAGADAVKFQMHVAEEESTLAEPWRVRFSTQDETRYDYWKRMEFKESEWHELAEHTRSRGLIFLCSPFSTHAVEVLKRINVQAWKLASGEITDKPLLDAIIGTRLPVLVSTGMSPLAEIDRVAWRLDEERIPCAVLQCHSSYPCPPEKEGLNMLGEFRKRYGCPVGLSDHSGNIYTGLAAATIGCDVLEIHVTFSREMFGPDVAASITTTELRELVRGIRLIEAMRANPVDKDKAAYETSDMRRVFFKGLVAVCDLPVGTVIKANDITSKKPLLGIPASHFDDVIGRRLIQPVSRNAPLTWEHFE